MLHAVAVNPLYFFVALSVMFWVGHWRGYAMGRKMALRHASAMLRKLTADLRANRL